LVSEQPIAAEKSLFAAVSETPAVRSFAQRLEQGSALSCVAVSAGAQPYLVGLLHHLHPERSFLVVTESTKSQEAFEQDLETWLKVDSEKARSPLFYPAWDILPHESKLPHADVISERLETLVHFAFDADSRAPAVVVSSVEALLQRTFSPEMLRERTRILRKGDSIDPAVLAEWLEAHGYEPEAQVNNKGEFAIRGGILDVFPPTSPWPVRLEFFGDDLESVRYFDPITQISKETLGEVVISPAGELGLLKRMADSGESSFATLLDYLPADTVVVIVEGDRIAERAKDYFSTVQSNDPLFTPWDTVREQFTARNFARLDVTESEPVGSEDEFPLALTSLESFRPIIERTPELQVAEAQRREFFAQVHRWLRQDYAVHVFCNNQGERQRFNEIWAEYGFAHAEGAASAPPTVHLGALTRGFLDEAGKLVVVTDAEIFGRYKVQRPRRLKSPHAQATRSALEIDFTDLDDGDYVVHVQHGIGRYMGLQTLPRGGGLKPLEKAEVQEGGQEYLVIEYASSDPDQPPPRLFVPISESHLVSKYVGTGKVRPPLNTLGGNRWTKAKEQAERAVRDLAGELLSIQAARDALAGQAFAPDTRWQREFESSFLFEETPDQMRAILDTKRDMELAKPMDRLICGDVGYGKTEVAIRAAFKAVMGGKQVAVLVPTTVLAQQHFNTFTERMADYPVRVEMLSRFRTPREQRRILEELAAGSIDIIIGTHRLVQDDIRFKDLGLVVIDEEQRFGVMHKEKFKMLRQLVDVLTLSATPIPRTLYLALTGARDMSTIQTPPADRLPVETIVSQFDERLIRDAIAREINRDGQVFYLHNRVSSIDEVAQRLRALVPKARIVVGHGQMHADDLEEVMTIFINGEADVLLSTTIIESGLDIPNANTIIIDRADRFGLSDLYQLRGRVGRYKHQAYAYLLLPRHAGLLTDARKRISAIKQYSSLGSGFKIAMRDLEIRGAGNLLGAQQSGHITAVGFDLYCQLLKQSVASLKGEKVKPRVETQVRLDFLSLNPIEEKDASADAAAAYIPMNYIPEPKQRIEIYRKLAEVNDRQSLEGLRNELRDRFGVLPEPVELLLQVVEIKFLASARNVTAIESKEGKLMITRNGDYVMAAGKFPRLTKKQPAPRLREIKKLLLAL
jgi:transcription-repair coupling factor (superfamily II helicase)